MLSQGGGGGGGGGGGSGVGYTMGYHRTKDDPLCLRPWSSQSVVFIMYYTGYNCT